jgi:arylformamidase
VRVRIYDISLGITPDLPVWPGDPQIELERTQSLASGAESNLSRLACSVHIGTHIDAPLHFIPEGGSVDQIALKLLTGRAYVVDLRKVRTLDAATLAAAGIPPRTRRLLFRTRNSELWAKGVRDFQRDYVAVDASGAQWLVQRGVQLVGVDYLSVAPFNEIVDPNRILLGAGVIVVEGLNLAGIRQGRYALYCLPLKLIGAEGAPARAILIGV